MREVKQQMATGLGSMAESIPYVAVQQDQHGQGKRRNNQVEASGSVDAFRGLTVCVMILVDNAGGAFPEIDHSPWDGITLADTVMPSFDFIVGCSIALSF